MSQDRFADRDAAVIGACGGIGRAVCRRLTAEGARVHGVDVDAAGLETLLVAGEVASAGDRSTLAGAGGLDVLVNAQGVTEPGDTTIDTLTPEVFSRVMAVNVESVLWAVQAALPRLRRAAGSVVNVSSLAGSRGAGGTAYVTSKAALNGLGMALAYQLAGDGVRVNTVAFGPVDTPMLRTAVDKLGPRVTEARRGVLEGVITPDEAAGVIAYLASPEAAHLTGSLLNYDGGRLRH